MTATGKVWKLDLSRLCRPPVGVRRQDGYLVTCGRQAVHRVVYRAWHGAIPPGLMVLHHDGDQLNNSAVNLKLGTAWDNRQDALRHGTAKGGYLDLGAVAWLLLSMLHGETDADAATRLDVTPSMIGAVRRGLSWRWAAPYLLRRAEFTRLQSQHGERARARAFALIARRARVSTRRTMRGAC